MSKLFYYKTKDNKGFIKSSTKINNSKLVETTKEQFDSLCPKSSHSISEKARQIASAKHYLSSTDWIITKIAEETDSDVIASLRSKYASIITERKAARARINELEEGL